jgi:hypothetical protein
VDRTDEPPFTGHCLHAATAETSTSQVGLDVAEDRLDADLSLRVEGAGLVSIETSEYGLAMDRRITAVVVPVGKEFVCPVE